MHSVYLSAKGFDSVAFVCVRLHSDSLRLIPMGANDVPDS